MLNGELPSNTMTGAISYDRLEELWLLIDKTHLGYLESKDSRGEQKKRLQTYMKEFLSVASHDQKFQHPQIRDVFTKSFLSKPDLAASKAAKAWAALAKYADNLILHPWRKEFREIKLYCGFYKHEIEHYLVDADRVFEAMGYKKVGQSTLTLHDLLDPDRLISVSKDAMLAELECNIMQMIWDKVHHYRLSWADILEYRQNYNGNADHASRGLIHRMRERHYHGEMAERPVHYGHGMHPPVPPNQPYAYQQRFAYVVNPLNHAPYNYSYPHYSYNNMPAALKPHEYYPSNGYQHQMYHGTPLPLPHLPSHLLHNGYTPPPPAYHPVAQVPTAQLIQVDTPPAQRQVTFTYPPAPARTTELPSMKAKDDGVGSWENWDYVYRRLEKNGYRKDNGKEGANASRDTLLSEHLRGMTLATTAHTETKFRSDGDGASRHRLSKSSIDLEDTGASKKILEELSNDKKFEKEDKTATKTQEIKTPTFFSEKEFELKIKNDITTEKPSKPTVRPNVITLDVSDNFRRETSPNCDLQTSSTVDNREKWECITCTYLNSSRNNACEMCGKSKGKVEIKSQPCGGRECPQCTFVNEKGKNFCTVCNYSLKDSPTYI